MRNNQPVDHVTIEEVIFSTRGQAVDLLWDATTDVQAVTLPADEEGYLDYRRFGGVGNPTPTAAGVSGNINLTTLLTTPSDGGALNMTLHMRKHT